jgi:hypothetical protein
VDHENRVQIDIETDDLSAELKRLEKLDATTVKLQGPDLGLLSR